MEKLRAFYRTQKKAQSELLFRTKAMNLVLFEEFFGFVDVEKRVQDFARLNAHEIKNSSNRTSFVLSGKLREVTCSEREEHFLGCLNTYDYAISLITQRSSRRGTG